MAFVPVKQFRETISGTATAARSLATTNLPFSGNALIRQIRVQPVSASVVVKLGDSTVVASATVTSGAFADGNFVVQAGAIELFKVKKTDTYYSAVSLDGSTGNCYVTVGFGEDI